MQRIKKENGERGAIVIEATIAFTAFIFAIYTIYSIINICYVQAKVSIALDAAAEELSQYCYIYYSLGLDEHAASASEAASEARTEADTLVDGIGDVTESFSNLQTDLGTAASNAAEGGTIDTDKLKEDFDSLKSSSTGLETELESVFDRMAEDPSAFLSSMKSLAISEGAAELQALIGRGLGKAFLKRNLKETSTDSADDFLNRYHVVDGVNGLDFSGTELMSYGASAKVQLVVTYDVEVIRLLNIDYTITFSQCAKTYAWGNGVSNSGNSTSGTTSEKNVWDMASATQRGTYIVSQEKKDYTYVNSGNGYDAYNPSENEFVTIMSVNTHAASYQTSSGIKGRLTTNFNTMYSNVSALDEAITVQNQSGENVSLTSDLDTRSYKMILVVPEDSDMAVVQQAINDFVASQESLGRTVTVEINTDYGSPSDTGEEGS